MRLRDISNILKNYEDEIIVTATKIGSTNNYDIKGFQSSMNKIEEISSLGFLEGDINRFKSLGESIYNARNSGDTIRVDSATHQKILHYITIVKEKIKGFQQLVDLAVPPNTTNVVHVKLPDSITLKGLSDFYRKLDIAFRTALKVEEVNGHYSLQNFDSGSLWTEIVLNNMDTILFLGKILSQSLEIKKQTIEIQHAKKQLNELKDSNPEAEHVQTDMMLKLFDEKLDRIIEEKIKEIHPPEEPTTDFSPESKNNIVASIRTFSELMQQGTEFYPSIAEQEEVQKAFPIQPKRLEEQLKLIEKINSNIEDTETEKDKNN